MELIATPETLEVWREALALGRQLLLVVTSICLLYAIEIAWAVWTYRREGE